MTDDQSTGANALRRQAEARLTDRRHAAENLGLEETKSLVQELRVHQVELELQNEELRRIQSQLEQSRARFSRLFNDAPIGYLTLDGSGLVLQSNKTFMDMVQADIDSLLGKPFTNFVAAEDKNPFWSRYRAFFNRPSGKIIELKVARKDGSTFFARLEGRLEEPEETGAGEKKQPAMMLVVSDVTEERASKNNMEKQARFLQSLLSAIPSPVFYKDRNGRYLGGNEAFEDLIGKPLEQIVGKTVHELWPTRHGADYHEKDLELLESPGKQRYEHTVVDAAGASRDMVFHKSSFLDADMEVAGIVGVIQDVTARKKAEDELRRKLEINAAMAELAETLLSGATMEDTSFLVLKKAQALTGSPYGFTGYFDRQTGHLRSPTLSRDIWTECDLPEKSITFQEFNGLWGWVLKNGKPLLTNRPTQDQRSTGAPVGHIPIDRFLAAPVLIENRTMGIIALCNSEHDYTANDLSVIERLAALFGLSIQRMWAEEDIRAAKEAAEAANLAKSNFLATMSHEIRTPMNAILGFTDLTLDSDITTRQRENLEIVRTSAQHLLNLLNDILDLSKIEAGRVELEENAFNLSDVLEEAARTLSIRATNKGLGFSHRLAPSLPAEVIGDRRRLHQVLFNLIGNAIKFTEKGEVKVDAAAENSTPDKIEVHFTVEDTGIGIPAPKQLEIFDPFTQADSSTTRLYGGTGLGLAISRKLVETMGGVIWVESEEGRGSVFHFTAPFTKISPQESLRPSPPGAVNPAPAAAKTSPILVLLVEDNRINQKLAKAFLEKKGCRALTAESGLQALQILKRETVDLVLMDIEMPGMNGLDAARVIRDLEENTGRRTPIIALTAHAMKGDRERFIASGMDDYLSKPLDSAALYRIIDRYSAAKENDATN
ncbi:MAG: ATP-binding protein [Pseudomonadota bacterium]